MTTIAPSVDTVENTAGSGVVAGVDTHRDTHTVAVLDRVGRVLGTAQFPATGPGYRALLGWVRGHGRPDRVGLEGSGAYGAGLAEYLQRARVVLVEVDRPDRATRRARGKSDPVDAVAAARAVLAGTATGTPKQRASAVESVRVLRVSRLDARDARARAMTRLKALLVTAPEPLRAQLRELSDARLVAACARLRPGIGDPAALRAADPGVATRRALHDLAGRYRDLTAQLDELDAILAPLVRSLAPALTDTFGVGPDTAGQLLVTAGANPDRIRTEAAFAALTGTSPVPASSGRTTGRHRLNRGGDRHANCALYRIALVRMRHDPRTRAYVERRTTQGRTKKEIIRCLKRYIAREIWTTLQPTTNPT